MDLLNLKPRQGSGTYRLGDSDDLVVMESIANVPTGKVCLKEHGIVVVCMEGMAQFEYDGAVVQLKKNDMFLYMANSVACNFMASPDFNCRLIWFCRPEIWNINIYTREGLADMLHLKLHPIVHLTDDDAALLDKYFKLLCQRMKDNSTILKADIVRSLVGTMLLEMLAIMRQSEEKNGTPEAANEGENTKPGFHKQRIVDRFIRLVEQSDGRNRRVDDFASQLNVTPKYLSTIFKEVMNRRPSVYIQLFTMKAIERRLRFTDMTIQEITYDLNFPNASFFGKYFKQHSGMTPMEYRKKYLKQR
jgi:AraC-like DNA-binding protein